MLLFIKQKLSHFLNQYRVTEASAAYNLLAETYDAQENNLVMHLDNTIFKTLINNTSLSSKTILDFGCGTGRHWNNILEQQPKELIGYDIAQEMLNKLQQKYPDAKTFSLKNNILKDIKDSSCDVIICNLVIGYIKKLEKVFLEWNRVLKKDGEIIITDFHPIASQNGANRSFKYKERMIYVKSFMHTLNEIKSHTLKLNWHHSYFIEKSIDETVKPFFKSNKALEVYNKNYNTPLVYGFLFRKSE
jgi:ubiquinone/menaquinone biosynthesis C-methylase UbiE